MDPSVIEEKLSGLRKSASLLDEQVNFVSLTYWNGRYASPTWECSIGIEGVKTFRVEKENIMDAIGDAEDWADGRWKEYENLATTLGIESALSSYNAAKVG